MERRLGGEHWTVQTGPCSTAEYGPRECRRFRFWFIVASYISRRRCLRLWCVGWHARRRVQLDRPIHIRWLNDGERERPSLYIYIYIGRREKKKERGRRKSRQREVTSMPIRAIHISWNTTLLRGTRPISFNALRYIVPSLFFFFFYQIHYFPITIFRANRAIEIPRFEKVSLVQFLVFSKSESLT